ncbi:MAG: phospholipase D family protein [Opitutales bacterium]
MRLDKHILCLVVGICSLPLLSCVSTVETQVLEAKYSKETFTTIAQAGTPELWDEAVKATKGGKPRVGLLEHGHEALVARVNLIRSARESIRIQTFMWSPDETGRWLVWELIRAVKQRGVLVEILIDQMFSEQDASFIAFLASVDPKLKVKLYNPNLNRIQPSTLDTLIDLASDFRKVNIRMHNKVMIVDDRTVIMGGRNLTNKYFDCSLGMNYKDRDILVVDSDCQPIIASFQQYWKSDWSVPAAKLLDVAEVLENGGFRKYATKGDFDFRGLFDKADRQASDPIYVKQVFHAQLMPVDQIEWVFDDPKKQGALDPSKGNDIATILSELVSSARKSILIQSPYVVLSDRAVRLFSGLKETRPNLKVTISTNSLAATDSWFTYAANYKEKRVYLQDLGFDLREFKPIPQDIHEMMAYGNLLRRRPTPDETKLPKPEFRISENLDAFPIHIPREGIRQRTNRFNDHLGTPPYLCLHGKSLVVDDQVSFVGSYNLDPRSGTYNTEVGLIVRDSEFAIKLRRLIERDMLPRNSYFIGVKKGLPILRTMNLLFYRISEDFPIFDPWPFRYATSFELRPNMLAVPPHHPDFYNNWRDVGSFPLIGYFAGKQMAARLFKTTGMIFKPLL